MERGQWGYILMEFGLKRWKGGCSLVFRTSGWFVEARTEGLYSGSRVGVLHIAGVRALARSVV